MIQPLLRDEPGADAPAGGDGAASGGDDDEAAADLAREQAQVARLCHLCAHEDTDLLFRVLGAVRKHFGSGGLGRIRHTLVPLVFRALALSRAIRAAEAQPDAPKRQYSARKVFQFVHEIATAMAGTFPDLGLHLFLQAALEADAAGFGAIAYEFVSQAFILYEDELPDSRAQLKALHSMVGALLATTGFDAADYDALATKTTQRARRAEHLAPPGRVSPAGASLRPFERTSRECRRRRRRASSCRDPRADDPRGTSAAGPRPARGRSARHPRRGREARADDPAGPDERNSEKRSPF